MVLSRSARTMSRSTTTDYGYSTDDTTKKRHQSRKKLWDVRNNSSNVSAALNSEMYNFGKIKKPVIVSNHCYKINRPPKFYCDGCYCRRSPVYPRLTMKRPTDRMYDELKKPICKLSYMYCQYGCRCQGHKVQSTGTIRSDSSPENKKASGSSPGSSPRLLGKSQEKVMKPIARKSSPSRSTQSIKQLYSTASKHNYVQSVNKTLEQLQKQVREHGQPLEEAPKSEISDNKHYMKINKHSKKEKKKPARLKDSFHFSPTITTISEGNQIDLQEEKSLENLNFTTENKSIRLSPYTGTHENLQRLSQFRREHYFDCHSTKDLLDGKTSEHKCVHKFFLDDRLMPQPIHADMFGTSRCIECDKPFKSEVVQSSPNIAVKEKTNSQTNTFGKSFYCPGQQTKYKINISSKNDRIEIKVPISLDKCYQLFNTQFKIRKPASTNSLALRHQKGVVC